MRTLSYFGLTLSIACFIPAMAPAQELSRETVVEKWLDGYAPEKLPELKYPAYFNDLDKAREQVFRGRYKTSLISLQKVKNADPAAMAEIRATALAATGRRAEALEVLADSSLANNLRDQILRARVLAELGRHSDSISLLKKQIEKHADSLAARYYLGEICEEVGDLITARAQYDWIHANYFDKWQGLGAKQFEDAELVTLMGRAFDRWATLNQAYANNAPLNSQIFNTFVQAYDVVDREYWPAHVAAAEFYISRENSKEAGQELMAALEGNPNDIHSYLLLGELASSEFNFDGAEKAIAKVRSIDATNIVADLLEAKNLLQQRRPQDAERPLKRVLDQQPNHIEALGLLAAANSLQLHEDKVQEILRQIEKIDPQNSSAYLAIANQLGAMRQYPRADKTFQIAIDRAPWSNEARNGLGLLLTQSGDEEKAKIVLEAARALDPFNYRTTNYLILLDKLDKMQQKESAHFIVKYDAASDPLIAEYFSDYLESIYPSVCGVFKTEPTVKTYIEVFPGHDAFSARITGSPWIGTVGASTGRVIALCTPRKGENTKGAYNWAQVLRHEFTHTVTLAATDNRISHWMTEGLAVMEERTPLRWEWVPMLYNAVKRKQLFSMDNLTWAFVRPKKPQDRALAYAESYWICTFIEEKWGHDAILRMMDEYKKGESQDEAFLAALGESTPSFTAEFFAWTEKQVAGWGYDTETAKKYEELKTKGEELMKARQYPAALKVWEEIVAIRPVDQLPHLRLAGLYLAKETYNPQKAIEHLIRLHQVSQSDNRFAKRIARLGIEINDLPTAEKYALQAVYVDPYDPDAHDLLLSVAEKTHNEASIAREQRVIPVLKEWIQEYRKSQLLPGAPQP